MTIIGWEVMARLLPIETRRPPGYERQGRDRIMAIVDDPSLCSL